MYLAMSFNARTRAPRPSIWRVRIDHNGGPWPDGSPQRARPRTEKEEKGQGGRRTPPGKVEPREEAPLRRSDGSVAAQPPERALGCSFGLELTRCTEPPTKGAPTGRVMLAIMPYPTRARLDQAFRGVPDERKSAETLEEQLGSGEQSAAARTQTARPWWSRMFGR
jgi:hypothetical protein